MIIKSVSASAFGKLKHFSSENYSSKLNVFYGRNEAGKSTLFNLIVTLLYGWKPVKDNAYIPWEGTIPLISGVIVTGDGQKLEVSRRLGSQPEGTLTMGDKNISLRNDAVTQVAFMSREVFQEIYALGLDQLRFPDTAAWQKLQDQLLGGQFGSFLRPVSSVLNELENEAANLWRSDRRGNPHSKILKQKIKTLRQEISAAEENEQELHRLESELDRLQDEQERLKVEKIRLSALKQRYSRLIPLRRQWHRLEGLKTQAGNIDRYDAIPAQPDQDRKRLEEEIEELETKMQGLMKKIEQAKANVDAFSETDRELMALGGVIQSLMRRAGHLQSDIAQRRELQQQLVVDKQRLHDRAGQFLKGGWSSELSKIIHQVDEVELKATIDHYSSYNQQRKEVAAQLEGLKAAAEAGKSFRLSKKAPLVALLMLISGITGSLFGGLSPLGIGSAVLGAGGLILLILWYLTGSREQEENSTARIREIEEKPAVLENKCRIARQHVGEALQGLPVAEQRLSNPEGSLLVDVKDLKSLLRDEEDHLQRLKVVNMNLDEAAAALQEPARLCGLQRGLSVPECIDLLAQQLTRADERRRKADLANEVKTEAAKELAVLHNLLNKAQHNLQRLAANVEQLPGENWPEKLEALLNRRRLKQQAATIEEELQRQYPDLEQLIAVINKAEAAQEAWVHSDEAEAEAEQELDEVVEALNQANKQSGILQSELQNRQQKKRLDDLQGQLSCLQEDLNEACIKRDRLILLRNLIAAADNKFREEHQPDVLQKAGRYLATITDDKYNRLSIKEDGRGLELHSNDYTFPLEVKPPVSRGTLEQIYLALRLAFIEHLDAGGERLPLFLDEALVNWDGDRLVKGLQLLNELSENRQVFLFTCHHWLAKTLEDRAKMIKL